MRVHAHPCACVRPPPPQTHPKKRAQEYRWPPTRAPKWAPTWSLKINFLDPKLSSILEGSWRPHGATWHFFGGPRSLPKTHPKWGLLELFLNSVLLLKSMFKRPHFWTPFWTALGPPKNALWRPRAGQTPPQKKMEPNLGLQKINFECPSWRPFWEGLGGPWAAQTRFF